MLQAVLVWSGAVLAVVVLALMALGPVIVEIDSWWYARRHRRRLARTEATPGPHAAQPARAVRSVT